MDANYILILMCSLKTINFFSPHPYESSSALPGKPVLHLDILGVEVTCMVPEDALDLWSQGLDIHFYITACY